jgi:hypothetical protein
MKPRRMIFAVVAAIVAPVTMTIPTMNNQVTTTVTVMPQRTIMIYVTRISKGEILQ